MRHVRSIVSIFLHFLVFTFHPLLAGQDTPEVSEAHKSEMEHIQKAIKHRGARWKAGHNPISNLSREERLKRLGIKKTENSSTSTSSTMPTPVPEEK